MWISAKKFARWEQIVESIAAKQDVLVKQRRECINALVRIAMLDPDDEVIRARAIAVATLELLDYEHRRKTEG